MILLMVGNTIIDKNIYTFCYEQETEKHVNDLSDCNRTATNIQQFIIWRLAYVC